MHKAQWRVSVSGVASVVSVRHTQSSELPRLRVRLYLYRTVENLEMLRVFELSFRPRLMWRKVRSFLSPLPLSRPCVLPPAKSEKGNTKCLSLGRRPSSRPPRCRIIPRSSIPRRSPLRRRCRSPASISSQRGRQRTRRAGATPAAPARIGSTSACATSAKGATNARP